MKTMVKEKVNFKQKQPPELLYKKKDVIKNFAAPKSFFNKVASLKPATLFKKKILTELFSCEFCEISKNTFFTEYIWWLLLSKVIS